MPSGETVHVYGVANEAWLMAMRSLVLSGGDLVEVLLKVEGSVHFSLFTL